MHTSQNLRGTAKERHRTRMGHVDVRDLDDVPRMPNVERYLAGLSYPATTQNLRDAARRNGAPEYVVELLDEIRDQTFHSHAELSQALDMVDW